MIETLNGFFVTAGNFIWSYIVVGLCMVVGLLCAVRLGFVQFRTIPHAVALLRGKHEEKDSSDGITTFQALSTAMSSTVGIGNIAGVAVAIKTGGPGAIFWMWVMALVGMGLKYVEGTLGSLYRTDIGGKHEMGGGPMYYISKGLSKRWRPAAVFYAVCTAVACLGAWNMFQSNQAAAVLYDQMQVPRWLTGLVLSITAALVLIGGISRIAAVAGKLVPGMCLIYVVTVFGICLLHLDQLPAVLGLILRDAFEFSSVGGGVLGSAVLIGIRRALFSNEAGTGSAGIAHAAAHTAHPVRQGIAASLSPFIDTVVVCGATSFVILLSGYYGTESYQNTRDVRLSFEAEENFETLNEGWQMISDGIPADDGKLQSFTHGERVMTGTGNALSIPLGSLVSEESEEGGVIAGLRFSGWYENAFPEINLKDDVRGETLVLSRSDGGIEGRTPAGEWGSWILKPGDPWLERLTEPDAARHLSLVIDAGDSGRTYLDRFELVSSANGIVLSTAAFSKFFGAFASIFIPIAALLFAYTTVIAGNYYGEVACHFLNEKLVLPYLWIYVAAVFFGCSINLDVVINFSDLSLGLMALPNLIALALLLPVVVRESRSYFTALKGGEFDE